MPVLDAGSVSYVVDGSILRVVDVVTSSGWSAFVERGADREVEVTFRNDGARVDLNLELEDGQVRVRIRDRRTGAETNSVSGTGSAASTSSTSTSSTSTTVPSSSTT
ncbi:MAG: hypothetical protein ACE5GB_07970, partial [Acidimicrobiales bacterium]